MEKILDMHGQVIPREIELEPEEVQAVRQRVVIASQLQHQLNCIRLEMELYLKGQHEELRNAGNMEISADATKVIYS